VLRDDDLAPLTAGSAPPPTTTQLDVLLAECQSAGMRIEVAGEPLTSTSLPPSLAHHVYRIVQEGLTNARKHAPGQVVQVAVTGLDVYGVDVHISNPVAPTRPDPNGVIPGAGVGLVGLRERVELIGGTLERTMEGGTHRLQAWLPWPT
jgi:signal transduction histidine kinase